MVTLQDVDNTAQLAKLHFSEEEKQKFTEQFNKIVQFVQKIGELDTENVKPTTHAVEKKNVFRDDKVGSSMPIEEFEENAPRYMERSIVVPRVIDR